ncbi:glucokinase [Heyndrickxia shackletonii]|uniref:Glucokinase n=1 Tax=Heyndrickxia shackletonii TaxID=157838 RepID=A0A0Q3WV40_9BACI|nr:ROK family glucokinase [Heyndrickxia shackletonii]KQL53543.1 glucokinase [Heyndrickxia shackletonii]NEY99623.1 ROK family glucokinase [Heyndrickxia shackletonii]
MEGKWIVGVDLGGTSVKLAFIQEDGEILHKWEIPTDKSEQGKNILPDIADSIQRKMVELGETKERLIGIGMGAPGAVDKEKGIIYEAVNLGWPKNYPIVKLLSDLSGLPVEIDNDANCAALGEMWKGAGNGAKNIACVTLGTGVGGGIIVNGDIVQGVKGAAGEIGHITIIPEGGAPCNCGKTGCLETVASATGIVRVAKDTIIQYEGESSLKDLYISKGSIEAKDVFDCMNQGDTLSASIIEQIMLHLGLVLANIGNVLNPEKIVIGGGVSKAGDLLLNPLQKYFNQFAYSAVSASTELAIATLGNDAGILGAAWLAKNKH